MYEVFISQSTDFVDNRINTTTYTTTNNSTWVGTIRAYKPQVGDVFTIREEQVWDILKKYHKQFRFIDRKRHIKWYNPLTWFRWYWVFEVVE